jgi:chromate reductase, NAD(P)H dehydrogenase (quinone)
MKITIISGTNRKGAMSLKVARKMLRIYESLDVNADVLDLSTLPSDIFVPTVYKEKPASFEPFQQAILDADGLLFIVPEYNGSYPGILKYFIDMWKFPESFENRCIAYVGVSAGMWGGLRSVEHLQGVMGYRNAFQFNERVFINNIYSRWDFETGMIKLLGSEKFSIEELLETQSRNFVDYCRRIRS